MATRVSYPAEIKLKAVEMRLAGVSMREVMEHLCIKNKTQVKTWVRWHRNGETHRFEQPVGKQYTYGKGPEVTSEVERLNQEIRFLKQQLDVLKKYKELERRCHQKQQSSGWIP